MSDRSTGLAPSKVTAVLGPTNTGKTHLAVERMLGHASGMIGLPLRLLAREIYDRIVKLRGARMVALITGEERIIPPRAVYFVCTVEAMPLSREVEFLAVDEIQLCTDPERGHVFTNRLLHARGKFETMFLGAATMAPLIRQLAPDAEFVFRERFSTLSYAGSKKITRLPRRSAIVAFSADSVYAIAELIRRQRGGAAVVMGSLSPRTRNAQVALYQSGEVDFLVATDAIGMGLNMDVDHVAFAGLRKFDGKRTRWLHPPEVAQIAGRAGRYKRDGTFGVTGECEDMDEDLVQAVETHSFEPIEAAFWRNAALDFDSLNDLMRSLARTPSRAGLKLADESVDEQALRALARDEAIAKRCRDRSALLRLWDVCQTPDFRKTTAEEHQRLLRDLFFPLTEGRRRLPDDWMSHQMKALDRLDGEIDALAGRLAQVRTLSYVANRPDWLVDALGWQGRMRELEDRLSDTLHEKLMARFVDRRTSALMRSLGERQDILAGVGDDGAVTVEGVVVGQLKGVGFEPSKASSALEEKALRAAAARAVAPEITRRLGRLAAERDDAFALDPEGRVLWRGDIAGVVSGAGKVRLLGEMGAAAARERATRRLEAFVAAETGRRLKPLRRLQTALDDGKVRGLARGIVHRLVEAGGILDRQPLEHDLKALSQAERRALKSLGVRFGGFSVFLPGVLAPQAMTLAQALTPPTALQVGRLSPLPSGVALRSLAARGLRAVGGYAAPVDQLERLDAVLRETFQPGKGSTLPDAEREALGWSEAEAKAVLRALDYVPQGEAWRRRRAKTPEVKPPPAHSPFAALSVLNAPAPSQPRPSRRHKPKPRKAEVQVEAPTAPPPSDAKARRRRPRRPRRKPAA
ncbi:MAG: phosphonate-binding protein [Caulobacterales bacterium]|nr:phosphonate-binding protein [Caulobacterales bacterium]